MLQDILVRYRARFLQRYGTVITPNQRSALNAMLGCRQGQYGELVLSCSHCPAHAMILRSCGHRACNQCQSHSTEDWLARQCQKQLPVNYYMATFTLPKELRQLAKQHDKEVYDGLIKSAVNTLKRFGLNDKHLQSELGMCAVLHTHTRRLDYHPHVHIVLPGGGIDKARKQWRKVKGKYLFNGKALAKVFRGECLAQLAKLNLRLPPTPKKWIVQCKRVGKGKQALQYLARYLYRGVIADKNILNDDGESVMFQYQDSKTKALKTRTLAGETFIFLLLQHVLPKGFRRARDYGFLHGNAKRWLQVVQWVLKVPGVETPEKKSRLKACSMCQSKMRFSHINLSRASPQIAINEEI